VVAERGSLRGARGAEARHDEELERGSARGGGGEGAPEPIWLQSVARLMRHVDSELEGAASEADGVPCGWVHQRLDGSVAPAATERELRAASPRHAQAQIRARLARVVGALLRGEPAARELRAEVAAREPRERVLAISYLAKHLQVCHAPAGRRCRGGGMTRAMERR
jgi:hypothetical protein